MRLVCGLQPPDAGFLDEFETQKENQSSLPHVILGGEE